MTTFNFNVERLKHRHLNLGNIVLMLIFLGVAFAPTDCQAQAVPTRNQSLMITKPTVTPPTPPLQKEIKELRQEVRDNKLELQRKIEMEKAKTRAFAASQMEEYQRRLEALVKKFLDGEDMDGKEIRKSKECQGKSCAECMNLFEAVRKRKNDEHLNLLNNPKPESQAKWDEWLNYPFDVQVTDAYEKCRAANCLSCGMLYRRVLSAISTKMGQIENYNAVLKGSRKQ